MKTDVEELSPTRVKLTVEVPFEELKSSLDKAYRDVGRQVRVPGFRPGRVPQRIIDQRVGRGAVLQQAVNDAVPELYARALTEHEVVALGQPEVEVTRLDDGAELAFTAEVDVRPAFEVPDFAGLPVTVDNAAVSDADVEEYLGTLRERFASLTGVDRAVQDGDFVSVDLAASVDGEPVEDAQASGVSYEVGSGTMLDGLDEALTGLSAGEAGAFSTELAGGELAGQRAEVSVTVSSVKIKELPELDDEFAQSASEFDTIGELRGSTRQQLERMRRSRQIGQAMERSMEALLSQIDIPLPERVVDAEIEHRRHSLTERLEQAQASLADYLDSVGKTRAELEDELDADARRSVKADFVLDKVAMTEEIGVTETDLTTYITEQAYRIGVPPDRLAQELSDGGQLNAIVANVLRSKAMAVIAERAAVTDEDGNAVDLSLAAAAQLDEIGLQGDDEEGDGEEGDVGAADVDGGAEAVDSGAEADSGAAERTSAGTDRDEAADDGGAAAAPDQATAGTGGGEAASDVTPAGAGGEAAAGGSAA